MKKQERKRRTSKTALGGALVALALLLGWCGRGFFLGDGAPGDDNADHVQEKSPSQETSEDVQPARALAPVRCAIRVDAQGVHIAGEHVDTSVVIAACQASGEADLTVTGDAKFGTADELRAALGAAGIRVFEAKAGQPTSAVPTSPDASL